MCVSVYIYIYMHLLCSKVNYVPLSGLKPWEKKCVCSWLYEQLNLLGVDIPREAGGRGCIH